MSKSLTYGYNRVSGADGFATEAVSQSVSQQTSLFTKLNTTGVRTNIQADTSVSVKSDVAGASGVAATVRANMAGAGAEVDRQFAAGMESIEKAKNEITAATKANGVEPGTAFPDTAMAPDSVAEMAGGIFEIKGASFLSAAMTQSSNVLSMANDIAAGMRGRPLDEVKEAIRDTLISNSGPNNNQETFAGIIVNAGDAPKTDLFSVDWERVFEEHPDALDQIFYANEDNLTAFPELAALQAAGEMIDDKVAELQNVQDEAEEYGFTADGVEVAGELPPAEIVAADADDPMSLGRIAIASLDASERDRILGAGTSLERDDTGAAQNREAELMALARTSVALEGSLGA